MARLLVKTPYLYLRIFMASGCFSACNSHCFPALFSKPRFLFPLLPLSLFVSRESLIFSCLLSYFRINVPVRRVSNQVWIGKNVFPPRAFMSSSITTEAFKESPSSKPYGSEQIQVSFLLIFFFIFTMEIHTIFLYI